jgi:hypothetical protein
VSLIVSKFIVALALGLGAAALGGGGPKDGDFGTQAGLTVQGVIVGVTLMSLAAFAPFVVLKLIPVLEAALIAQGISRGPLRAAQTGMQGAYYARGLQRLAGGPGDSGGGQGGGGGANGSRPGPGGGPQGGSPTGGGGGPTAAAGLGRGGGVGAAGAGGAAGGGATGGSATAGGGAAAAGPAAAAAAAVMMPVGAAKALAGKAANTTTQAKPES